ncbi:hypothetical protein KIP63_04840 [Xanthomonas campestris pv. campestris]|nr:hypothetical protein [Xanthomonas campestris]MBB3779196.1 hypothetical protein [Xanthomonas euroxanthea]MBB4129637.1 hypothetical protein [Xanthomonas sp. 3075]MCD0274287.1 hypothetical protein [Xanthomonas campestris pv. campestris]MCF8788339.1 hypothetical protein [Xanthomonas campestris pv. campestris]MCF8802378.1 hypothetical protein [Xanthomonas campestris pv. campestris]
MPKIDISHSWPLLLLDALLLRLLHRLLTDLILLDGFGLLQVLLGRLQGGFAPVDMSMEERPFVSEGRVDGEDVLGTRRSLSTGQSS